ncbi:sugar transporter [Beauveria bassiana ARSEF 2860]|uniref:Sugar transporter n=1 Tax=Beauveria bassiana (strain ARSEF 2860) TaxID=655819 RepID=J5JC95_BEAB2|nr:sugar transporter [Beauveria bassiana ARSEF 2860]EJP63668.1 sugar transporter [Beauveria bassiana ARSEF 2860]
MTEGYNTSSARKEPSIEKTGTKSSFLDMFVLPQWTVGGKLLEGRMLNNCIGIIASCGFLMFGYDQGVLSALLTLDDFQKNLPLMTPRDKANPICWLDDAATVPDPNMCTGDANTQAAGVAIYQVGCFLGAVLVFFYGESWGRKSSTFWGSLIMIIGTVMQAACFEYGLFVAGRVVGGIGNGMVTSTIPTWQSECARPHKRGFLIMLSGALISGGIMIAYWVDFGFYFLQGSVRWRFPIAFQSFFTLIVMWGLMYLPESPRWLAMHGRMDEAAAVTGRLLGKPIDHEETRQEMQTIIDGIEAQGAQGKFNNKELLTGGASQNLRRTLIGVAAQFGQQICGINLITYYATFLFENSLGFSAEMSRLLAAANGTEYFLASLVALPLIERTGRRTLMLFGAFGMMASMTILAGTVSTGTTLPNGWLGMTWLYPAEITNLRIRIQANALSTCSNWLSNFLIVMITPPAFANLGYRTYIMFAVFNAAIIPMVWFFFPEPKGRSLEELDVIFASAYVDKVSPVQRAKEMRHIEGSELDSELDKYFGAHNTADHA